MKKVMRLSMVLAVVVMALTGCNCFKKMAKNRDDIKVSVTPELLTLKNGMVAADITVTFPVEYFNAKAVLKVTPVLVFEGGEVAGAPKYYQGSKVDDNYTVVDAANGGKVSQHVEFHYDHRMALSELQLRAEVKCPKGGCKEFTLVNLNTGAVVTKEEQAVLDGNDEAAKLALLKQMGMTVARGVNTLQNDLKLGGGDIHGIEARTETATGEKSEEASDDAAGYGSVAEEHNPNSHSVKMMSVMHNDFKRVTTEVEKTSLKYSINSSNVTKDNQSAADLDGFKGGIKENIGNDRATQNITVMGYASPDGPEKLNDRLSKARSESGKAVIARLLKGTELEVDAAAYGEDWDGFKELVEKSNIKDKNLILQVLSLYNSPVEREREIKNMSSVYGELKSEILPELRRAQIVNTIDLQGNSDEEIMQLYRGGDDITAEEYLYAAEHLSANPAEQLALLTKASEKYPNDARIWNNLSVAQMGAGNASAALASAEKASKLNSTPEITKNLVITNLANGRLSEAKKYAQASDAEAKGVVAAAEGDYIAAASALEGYNAAIIHAMNANYSAAKKEIAGDASADADYLRAVIAAKEGDMANAEAQLKSAVKKNPALAEKAARDINLIDVKK